MALFCEVDDKHENLVDINKIINIINVPPQNLSRMAKVALLKVISKLYALIIRFIALEACQYKTFNMPLIICPLIIELAS